MGLKLAYGEGQTPLSEEEKEGLLIKTITTHGELDEHEQLNIEKAIEWIIKSRFKKDQILTEGFLKLLHKKMLGQVWSWAGSFRQSEKNIGVRWINIGVDLRVLLDDVKFWIDDKTYPMDEIAIRFKHRLVSIHCFPNGNGRHSRIMADVIMESLFNEKAFSWNQSSRLKPCQIRKKYISALREGDRGRIHCLLEFARN